MCRVTPARYGLSVLFLGHLYACGGQKEHQVLGLVAFTAAAYCSYRFAW